MKTFWVEVTPTNSKPFLICSVYRPPNTCADLIDLFEQELSLAQTTGLEYLVMGDIIIDSKQCSNSKWTNLTQLFDLSQLITEPTECFVPQFAISDHYPVCFTKEINYKIRKIRHKSSSHRCCKNFDAAHFLSDFDTDLWRIVANRHTVGEDFVALHSVITKHVDKHAPVKRRRVKCNCLPE